MRVFRSLRHPGLAAHCALTIGNFDGVHRGHQAMLALLVSEAAHRNLPATVLTFEPNPRDYFAGLRGQPETAPARIATLRDKLCELERCGVAQAVVMRFDAAFAAGDMAAAAALLGRPYSVSGRVVHGARLGRVLGETSAGRGDGYRTLNVRFGHPKPAAMGIFVVRVHGLDGTSQEAPVAGVASLGKRPTVDD